MPEISVVIPVFKAENILFELHRRLVKCILSITADYEIILVNDGSPGNDWVRIIDLSKFDSRVKGINLSRNFGQHYAITAGLDFASGKWVVVMDCDLQDQPEEIPKMYEKILEGYDVVFGRRIGRKDNFIKKLISSFFYRLYGRLVGVKVDKTIANFSIISHKAVLYFRKFRERSKIYGFTLNWIGLRRATIDIEHSQRFEGKSAYTFFRLFRLAFDNIISQSNKPLMLSIILGMFFVLSAFCYMIFLIARYLSFGTLVEGWTSVMVSIWFIGGLVIANLGILGLYVGKIYDEAKNRPLYIIQDVIGIENPDANYLFYPGD